MLWSNLICHQYTWKLLCCGCDCKFKASLFFLIQSWNSLFSTESQCTWHRFECRFSLSSWVEHRRNAPEEQPFSFNTSSLAFLLQFRRCAFLYGLRFQFRIRSTNLLHVYPCHLDELEYVAHTTVAWLHFVYLMPWGLLKLNHFQQPSVFHFLVLTMMWHIVIMGHWD